VATTARLLVEATLVVVLVVTERVAVQEVLVVAAAKSTSPTFVCFHDNPSAVVLHVDTHFLASLQCWLAGPEGLVSPSR
jgi:hypothetical protein